MKCGNVREATDELMLSPSLPPPPPAPHIPLRGVTHTWQVCLCMCVRMCVCACVLTAAGQPWVCPRLDCWETCSLKHR